MDARTSVIVDHYLTKYKEQKDFNWLSLERYLGTNFRVLNVVHDLMGRFKRKLYKTEELN